MPPLTEQPPRVWFNTTAQEWQDEDGKPVCQRHAEPLPCPFDSTTEAPA